MGVVTGRLRKVAAVLRTLGQQLFAMPDMYAAIFAAGALGYGLNLLFLVVERRFVHWAGK